MLNELKELFIRQDVTSAAIIDDVFDETPTSADVEDTPWNFFLDDIANAEIEIVRGYGVADPEDRWDELRRDDRFIQFLWDKRKDSQVLQSLFSEFQDRQDRGKAQLEPLRKLLFDDLDLQGGVYGARAQTEIPDAQLLFVDLFLGGQQDQVARDKAVERVKSVVEARRASPPALVLMSSSTRLSAMKD
jgi:hypothetical protein